MQYGKPAVRYYNRRTHAPVKLDTVKEEPAKEVLDSTPKFKVIAPLSFSNLHLSTL